MTIDDDPGNWRKYARCATTDPEVFFPEYAGGGVSKSAMVRMAKAVCSRCPVQPKCLAWALHHLPWGIAGGMTEKERDQTRVHLGIPPLSKSDDVIEEMLEATITDAIRAGRSNQEVAHMFGVAIRTAERWRRKVRLEDEEAS